MALFLAGSLAGQMPSGKPVVKFASGQVMRTRPKNPELVLTFQIAPGYHVQAHHPNSAYLIPTRITLHAPAGIRLGRVVWPKPDALHLSFSRKPLLVYTGRLRVKAGFHGKSTGQPLRGVLEYQACTAQLCQPPTRATFHTQLH